MTLFSILETILIGPLKLVFEIIFNVANRVIGHPGLAIIVLSLTMNILVLPLYRRADAMQEEARDIDAKLKNGIEHIKKTFSGDERMMILQTYYRQNHYSPVSALNGSVSLLLEIPFFIAAYQFLSHAIGFEGVSLGPITDLSAPDGLIVIGGVAINVLPILMTLINFVSSAIYLKGFPLKTKIQLYAIAVFFLVFLYESPSCLVFYWTLNNVFSFVKNVFYKLKNPRKVLTILLFATGLAVMGFGLFVYDTSSIRRKLFVLCIGFVLLAPMVLTMLKGKFVIPVKEAIPNGKVFLFATVFMTVLVGVLIPSVYISESPQEYVNVLHFRHPLMYLVNSVALAVGTFLVWFQVFYRLADNQGKALFDKAAWVLCGVMLVNYMSFGTGLGNISSMLQYSIPMVFTVAEQMMNLVVIVLLAVVLLVFYMKCKKHVTFILMTAIIAMGCMSARNVFITNESIDNMYFPSESVLAEEPTFKISKSGNNVAIILIDRALGEYVPYLFNEKPELQESFSGFTYYSNTISYGRATNLGSPAVYGGYEYTPVEMNKRADESLVAKHNEALKVMPVLFDENGYEVTVCDPPYANYQWFTDLSIYEEYPDIAAYNIEGKAGSVAETELITQSNDRNFFVFALMKTMPLVMQPTIYDNGMYNQTSSRGVEVASTKQVATSMSTAVGTGSRFVEAYNILGDLSQMTQIVDEDVNTCMIMYNSSTHEKMLLQTPNYVPAMTVDNTDYDLANTDRFVVAGRELKVENAEQMSHYHVNMAAYLQLASWFDYLRDQGVYDNTRIILVSDHGRDLHHLDELEYAMGDGSFYNLEQLYPLLMMKDFNSKEFSVSDVFMTNADVATLATADLIEEPRNPFTGKLINSNEKYAHEQYVTLSMDWDTDENNRNTFSPSGWASVKDNLWDLNNWTFYADESVVLSEHEAP